MFGEGTLLWRQKRKKEKLQFVDAQILRVRPLRRCKWEPPAWVPQVTGLRGHIIDPFGGIMTARKRGGKEAVASETSL